MEERRRDDVWCEKGGNIEANACDMGFGRSGLVKGEAIMMG